MKELDPEQLRTILAFYEFLATEIVELLDAYEVPIDHPEVLAALETTVENVHMALDGVLIELGIDQGPNLGLNFSLGSIAPEEG